MGLDRISGRIVVNVEFPTCAYSIAPRPERKPVSEGAGALSYTRTNLPYGTFQFYLTPCSTILGQLLGPPKKTVHPINVNTVCAQTCFGTSASVPEQELETNLQ